MVLQGLYLDKNIPTPFNNKETMACFKKGTPEAKEEIIKHNIHMVVKIIESKYSKSPYKEELFEEGLFGLIHAVNTYSDRISIYFSGYASMWIQRKIQQFLATTNEYTSLSDLEDEEDLFFDLDDIYYKERFKEAFKIFIERLEPSKGIMMKMYFYDGFTQTEIAQKLGVKYQWVNEVIETVLIKMRRELKNVDNYLQMIRRCSVEENLALLAEEDITFSNIELRVINLKIGNNYSNQKISLDLGISEDMIEEIMKRYFSLISSQTHENKKSLVR